MELWIRSQDKTRLSIITNIQLIEQDGEYSLVGYAKLGYAYDYLDDFDLGKYQTKERALEVLDEIEAILIYEKLERITGSAIIQVNNNVAIYEMPMEEDKNE